MLNLTLARASLRHLWRRSWQLILMVAGVALGVAMVIAIDLANASALRAFRLSAEAVTGRATHRILGGPSGVPEDVFVHLKRQSGLGPMAPIVEGLATAPNHGDQPLRILGIDPFSEAPFRDLLGEYTPGQSGFERFYLEPGSVILASELADRLSLKPGGLLRLQVNGNLVDVRVIGVLRAASGSRGPLPDDLILTDIASAQELLGWVGRLSRIDLMASQAQLRRIEGQLPQPLRVELASEQASTAEQLTSAFRLNLTALSLLALVVGMFLIYNTVMFSVVQRRVVFATFRALGTTGAQLFALILVETWIVAGLGTLLGVGMGWFLGQGAVRLVSQTINDLYFVVNVREMALTPGILAKAVLVALLSSTAAAAGPGYEAARVPPVLAMQRSSLEQRVRNWLPWASLLGLAMAAAGVAFLAFIQDSLLASFIGMFAILLGLALLVPLGTVGLMGVAGDLLRRSIGVLGGFAARTVVKALSRTSVAISALMVALSVTIGVGLMIDSFRDTVINWLDLTLRADVYVSAPIVGGSNPTASLDPGLQRELSEVPGVMLVETFRTVTVESQFGPIQLNVADANRERDARVYRFAQGTPAEIWDRVLGGAVIVSEPFAYHYEIPFRGGEIRMVTDHGEQAFPVVAVYYDYSTDRGTVLMSENVYHRYWEDPSISSLALYLEPQASLERVAPLVRQELTGTGLEVSLNREVREEALRIFDRTFAITVALRVLAVLVAFIGVLGALLALQLERTSELATLQAIGLTGRGMWGLTLLESALMGGSAALMAIPTGIILAVVLIYVINVRSFGWTIQMDLDPTILIQAIGVGLLAAMTAAAYPLIRLRRLPIAEALAQE